MWNKEHIDEAALGSASADYAAFEAIGLSELPDAHVLDVGCFDGFNTRLKFTPYKNIKTVVGIDPNGEAIKHAKETTDDKRFTWVQASCMSFDDQAESFDVAYFSHSFQHLANKEAGLANVLRLLKPGGFIIIKTVDDSNKLSYPDPEHVMKRLFALYEHYVLPATPHTHTTERNNGQTCYTRLIHAGFENICIRTLLTDTIGKSKEQRHALFERCVYFRRTFPSSLDKRVALKMNELIAAWEALFEREDYYYATSTFIALAQKPSKTNAFVRYCGPLFDTVPTKQSSSFLNKIETEQPLFNHAAKQQLPTQDTWQIDCLHEADLSTIMTIELASFPDPWAPVAYAMELRHNPCAHYIGIRSPQGVLSGYLGWWEQNTHATIVRIAVNPKMRRTGLGRMLVEYACNKAHERGYSVIQLQVRAQNHSARSFYVALGFEKKAVNQAYYTNPTDDAVLMARTL